MIGARKARKFLNDAEHATNAKHRKLIADAAIKEQQAIIETLKKEKLQGSLISLKETQEAFLEIGSKTKANLYRLISTLPPKLEGLNAQAMIEIIRESIDEICLGLSQSFVIVEPKTIKEDIESEEIDEGEADDQ